MGGGNYSINRFKQWFQVQYMGHTVEQFLSQEDALLYISMNRCPNPCLQRVSQRRGQTIRRISIYP